MKKVFLSSTARDLSAYRQAVYDAIEGLDGYHCIRMENFGARDVDAKLFDREKVAECDIFIGIIGFFHGSTPIDDERSYTELEYDTATKLNKPRLMFLSSDDTTSLVSVDEPEKKKNQQKSFRNKIKNSQIVSTFRSLADLSSSVIIALSNLERSDSSRIQYSDNDWFYIPKAPTPYLAHPYPLQEHFTGRSREMELLSSWLSNGDNPVFVLTGIGGLGKSALTWVWLNQDTANQHNKNPNISMPSIQHISNPITQIKALDGVIWWSFYESDATFTSFLQEALVYTSSNSIEPRSISSNHAKARSLLNLLQNKRFLIVFDGFERVLRAYSGLGSPYKEYSPEDRATEDGNMCIDPLIGKFLFWCTSSSISSRILITTRMFPKELESIGGSILLGCHKEELNSLDLEDAVALFKALGVKGTRFETREVCQPYGYHALTLRLLAGYIANHFERPGDITVGINYNPILRLIPRKHNILDLAYNALNKHERLLLSRIAAFRAPKAYNAIRILSPFQDDSELDHALQILIQRGILLFDRVTARFDLHPIIRRYAYDRLTEKTLIHSQLKDYFSNIPDTNPNNPSNTDELSPIVELFYHTISAGAYQDAYQLYKDRISPSTSRIGAFQLEIDLMKTFIKDSHTNDLYITTKEDQIGCLTSLGVSYGYTGQPRQAIVFFQKSIKISEQKDRKLTDIANSHGNIAYFQMKMGLFRQAEQSQLLAVSLTASDGMRDTQRGYAHMRLGLLMSYTGRYNEATQEFRTARRILHFFGNDQDECFLWIYRIERALFVGNLNLALLCAKRALILASKSKNARLVTRAENALAATLIRLSDKYPIRRQQYISATELLLVESLTRCRKLEIIELEVISLLNWSYWHMIQGDIEASKKFALESLRIADRCEYRLDKADIHNALAKIAEYEQDNRSEVEHARLAYKYAWCDGPPYAYESALTKAKYRLAKLGVAN